jgi:hypothetical protein
MESWHSYTDGEIRQYKDLGGVERQVYTECMGGRETELENVWKWRGTYKDCERRVEDWDTDNKEGPEE